MTQEQAADAEVSEASLRREVGLWGAVWMGLGSILGTGVFVSIGIATGVIGHGIVVAVFLAALVAVANGLSSAQLAAAHPVSGGTYEYGHRYLNPWLGFTAGWMFLAAKSASAATAALGCAGYILHSLDLRLGDSFGRIGLALGIVLTLTALVAGGVRRSNHVNILIVTVTLAALCAFIVAGGLSIDVALLSKRIDTSTWSHPFSSPKALGHATALMFVAYTGYGRIATLGEEVQEPSRIIPRAIITTLVISMALYVLVSAVAIAAVGPEWFAISTQQSAAPLELVAQKFDYSWVASLVAIGAITAMAGVLLNLLLGLSRVLLAMARRGEMPRSLRCVGQRTGSPARAVWAIGGLLVALVLIGDIKITWTFSAFTVLVYYGLTNLAALRLPPEARRFPRWIALVGLVSCFGLAFFVPWKVWLAGLGLVAIGLVWRGVTAGHVRDRSSQS